MREKLKPYITEQMQAAHEKGTPVMRPLFYDFPKDAACWECEDEYLFGPDILVAPVLYAKISERQVYLPAGETWVEYWSGRQFDGGQTITVPTPIEQIPLFLRNGKAAW